VSHPQHGSARDEGILRAHRLGRTAAARLGPVSITAAEWPVVRVHLAELSRERVLAS
jgi:hypothetical protein